MILIRCSGEGYPLWGRCKNGTRLFKRERNTINTETIGSDSDPRQWIEWNEVQIFSCEMREKRGDSNHSRLRV